MSHLGRQKIIFSPKVDVFISSFPNLQRQVERGNFVHLKNRRSFISWCVQAHLNDELASKARGQWPLGRLMMFWFWYMKLWAPVFAKADAHSVPWPACVKNTLVPPTQSAASACLHPSQTVWNRKKPSLTWLVHIKVWLVSQIGIKICRETCCTRAAQSFVGQCRFCISGSLVFEALLMNAEITWLPYFLIFELELSTFLGMLWLRIHLAFEDEPLGSPLVIFHRKGICPTRMKVNFVLGSICGLMQAVIIFVCCFYPW